MTGAELTATASGPISQIVRDAETKADASEAADEVAAFLRCSTRTVARMCENGTLRACRAGNRWRINRDSLMAYAGIEEEITPKKRRNTDRKGQPNGEVHKG